MHVWEVITELCTSTEHIKVKSSFGVMITYLM